MARFGGSRREGVREEEECQLTKKNDYYHSVVLRPLTYGRRLNDLGFHNSLIPHAAVQCDFMNTQSLGEKSRKHNKRNEVIHYGQRRVTIKYTSIFLDTVK